MPSRSGAAGRRAEFDAELVGRDAATDVALLRVEDVGAICRRSCLGDSDRLEVGDWVVAIGNPFGLDTRCRTG